MEPRALGPSPLEAGRALHRHDPGESQALRRQAAATAVAQRAWVETFQLNNDGEDFGAATAVAQRAWVESTPGVGPGGHGGVAKEYNEERPHSALGDRTPKEFIEEAGAALKLA